MTEAQKPHHCCLPSPTFYARYSAVDEAGTILMTGGHTPHLWDLATGRQLRALPVTGFPDYYADWAVALTPDGRRAIASYSDYSVRVWDTASGDEVVRWQAGGVATGMAATGDCVLIGNRWLKLLM